MPARPRRYKGRMLRRHLWWLAPLAGAAIAGAVVAAVSLGGGARPNGHADRRATRSLQPAAAALAFQSAITARRARALAVRRPDPEPGRARLGRRLRLERRHRHEQPRRRRRRPVHRHGRRALLRRVARRPLPAGRPGHRPRLGGEARTGGVRGLEQARGRGLRDRDRQPARAALERHRRDRQRLPPGRLGGERRRAAAR